LPNAMLPFLKEFWLFLRKRKKFWLVPILVVMLTTGALLILAQSSAVAPFIYTLF
jgi:competence protein ComGC